MGNETYDEAAFIEASDQLVAVDTPFGRVALSICYDLRFPELYRALGTVDLIMMPAAFTDTTGRAHWDAHYRFSATGRLVLNRIDAAFAALRRDDG